MNLTKHRKSKSSLDQKLCHFWFFHCDIIFDKLSELGQISCVVPYYIEIKDSLYLGKFFVNFFENWYKMKKIIAYHNFFFFFVKYFEEGVETGAPL